MSSPTKSVLTGAVSNVAGALILIALVALAGALWSFVTDGGLLRALGGVSSRHAVQVESGWVDVRDSRLLQGNGARIVTRNVTFRRRFVTTPTITLAVNGLDASASANTRVGLGIRDVTLNGFEFEVGTWADSVVYSVGVSWLAVASMEVDEVAP